MLKECIKATAKLNGKHISSVYYDKSEQDPKNALINSLYWNNITCSEASEPKWWEKYEITIILTNIDV